MYLFSRRLRARTGDPAKAMAWATGITERVRQISGLDVSLYSSVFGPEVGTLVFSAFVPDLGALETAADKLVVDDGYLTEVVAGQQFAPDGADDRLVQVLHPTDIGIPTEEVNYVAVVEAVSGPNMAACVETAIAIARRSEAVTGRATLVASNVTGAWGGISWMNAFPDLAAAEAANQAISADADWMQLVQEAGNVFADDPGATQQRMYRRII